MARTAITPTVLAVAGAGQLTDPAGQATTAGANNGVSIASALAFPELTIFRVNNASGGSGTVSVKAGAGVAAISAGQGDHTFTVANGATAWIGPFESARIGQADGSIAIDTSVIMTITAFKVNRH